MANGAPRRGGRRRRVDRDPLQTSPGGHRFGPWCPGVLAGRSQGAPGDEGAGSSSSATRRARDRWPVVRQEAGGGGADRRGCGMDGGRTRPFGMYGDEDMVSHRRNRGNVDGGGQRRRHPRGSEQTHTLGGPPFQPRRDSQDQRTKLGSWGHSAARTAVVPLVQVNAGGGGRVSRTQGCPDGKPK